MSDSEKNLKKKKSEIRKILKKDLDSLKPGKKKIIRVQRRIPYDLFRELARNYDIQFLGLGRYQFRRRPGKSHQGLTVEKAISYIEEKKLTKEEAQEFTSEEDRVTIINYVEKMEK